MPISYTATHWMRSVLEKRTAEEPNSVQFTTQEGFPTQLVPEMD